MKNGCAVKITILEDGKMVDFALGVIEKPDWLDPEKPERKIAWLEVFGNRYIESRMYSGGQTGGGFNNMDIPRTDDPEKKITVITRDPMEAIRFLDKEAERRQTEAELRRQAAINAVSRVNADVSCREILATHPDGSRMVLVRYPAEYLIHSSNKFHCVVALRKFGKHQDIFDLDNGTPVDLEDYMTKTHIVDARKIKAAELFLFGQYFTKPAYRIEAFKKLQGQVTAFKARINAIRFEEEKALGL